MQRQKFSLFFAPSGAYKFADFTKMLIDFDHFLARNLLSNKYFKPIFKKNLYLFLLGLSFGVGDFKLILATVIFVLSMMASYQLRTRSLNYYLSYFRKILNPDNKKLVLSITTAGLLSIFVYFSLNVYSELDNTWLALFVIFQTLFSTLGIVFFGRQLFSFQLEKNKQLLPPFEELVKQLNNDSSLQRLWVINQIIALWQNNQLSRTQLTQLEEYFLLLKNNEFEPLILDKINHSLQKLSLTNSQPLNIPRTNNTPLKKNPLPIIQTVNLVEDE